jgi:hypothetical protein
MQNENDIKIREAYEKGEFFDEQPRKKESSKVEIESQWKYGL